MKSGQLLIKHEPARWHDMDHGHLDSWALTVGCRQDLLAISGMSGRSERAPSDRQTIN